MCSPANGEVLDRVDADDFRDMPQPIALDQAHQALSDATEHARAFVDERRKQLHQRGAEPHLGIGILGSADAAGADDHITLAVHATERFADAGIGERGRRGPDTAPGIARQMRSGVFKPSGLTGGRLNMKPEM